jgi:hypothetical protein
MMPPAEIRNFLAIYDDACHPCFPNIPLAYRPSRYRRDNRNKYITFLTSPQDYFLKGTQRFCLEVDWSREGKARLGDTIFSGSRFHCHPNPSESTFILIGLHQNRSYFEIDRLGLSFYMPERNKRCPFAAKSQR